MRTSHRAARKREQAWLPGTALLVIYLGSTLDPLTRGDWRSALTFLLAGLGFVVTMFVKNAANRRLHTDDDRKRLDVLTLQTIAAFLIAGITDAIWRTDVVGAPLAVTLAAVVTAAMAAEALAIHLRGKPLQAEA
jgi:hypothetical protein